MKTIGQPFIGIFIVLGLVWGITGGCSKQKKTEAKSRKPVTQAVSHEARGEAQRCGCDDELNDIFFISRTTLPPGATPPATNIEGRVGFIAGKANTLLKTMDGGTTWRRILERKTEGPHFTRIFFMNTNEGWAVSRDMLLHTRDSGETWIPAKILPENFYYFGPCAATAVAYYQMQPPTCGASVWQTRNGGVSWAALPTHLPRNDFGAVFFFDDRQGWVAGNYGLTARTEDGGQTWQEQTLTDGGRLSQIQFVSPQTGWMRADLGHKGNLWASRDGGRSWQAQPLGIASYWNVEDMQFLDAQIGFILIHVEAKINQVMRTLDGGATWEIIGIHPVNIAALCFISATEGWVVGAGGCVFHYQL
ncbi:MAG: hypothetical protein KKG09_01630 [Verrucomicrobia bacterium]|nr:hypothetical protein [Verrucomicrobiota bacterium]MBU4292376.1 hypothetical protein [Verrucomicrobiota bacterium]MBU4427999.1 hypothetical protein [Verrucomicrobiota bacterium]MBU4496694.1 hypothetical protein [Verrucomicrobiota bacterium]MCG2679120.1 YCF48-related protein [Kiritimatiellia bacterium]